MNPGIELCDSQTLTERGKAVLFEVRLWNEPVRAFALRFEGRAVAYVNRCAHVPAEMDWQPGEFLDDSREWIICSIHGAVYDPRTGECVAGPCARARLIEVPVGEHEGKVYWYPSDDVQPVSDG
ncbi:MULTISPECIES: Rieske 2Fe-2S domain-containing protein [Caldimonas]|jgi:nitrite reductase/ring-hydroxylating ferredoxin subunit|uniref:Rieske (2Fe-2S) protein n=1 Tax=Caldimonas TaxID=196013 RepID=UPI0003639ABC|nr:MULTISPECIES: Rieske 2Fe-2S domain-containing protein [Caldimonas]MCX7658928.1 Rieske 2Fe-2S domain-containing protein [Caldimonas manganoxidans]GIX23133.1 MAG: Rieske iron-sulfur protein [Caldimonas sp.]